MTLKTKLILAAIGSHIFIFLFGFALGIYTLPILTERPPKDLSMLSKMATSAQFTGEFESDLPGNDLLHWGEGKISITETHIVHEGTLAPGPDYMLYLVPKIVGQESDFLAIKDESQLIGPVTSFRGFALKIPKGVKVENYQAVLVWCESFSEFIALGKYQAVSNIPVTSL